MGTKPKKTILLLAGSKDIVRYLPGQLQDLLGEPYDIVGQLDDAFSRVILPKAHRIVNATRNTVSYWINNKKTASANLYEILHVVDVNPRGRMSNIKDIRGACDRLNNAHDICGGTKYSLVLFSPNYASLMDNSTDNWKRLVRPRYTTAEFRTLISQASVPDVTSCLLSSDRVTTLGSWLADKLLI